MNTLEFGKKLKDQRESKSESQADLGKLLGVGIKQIQRYEKGELLPSHEDIEKLCLHYQYDFISLIYNFQRAEGAIDGKDGTIYIIEFKTSSGKKLEITPRSKAEIQLLNALLEERENIINEKDARRKEAEERAQKIDEEKKELLGIIKDNLTAMHVNLKSNQDHLELLVRSQRSEHTVMMNALDRLEKKKPGTLATEAGNLEIAIEKSKKKDKQAGVRT